MEAKKFAVSKWFVIANYIAIAGSFVFAALFILRPILVWQEVSSVPALGLITIGLCFLAGGIYSISIVPQMKDIVHISESQIMRENAAEGTFTTIWWKENFTVRNRQFLGRLELISQDGQRIVKIEHQTENFQQICEFIKAKLADKNNETNGISSHRV